jgi:hypothetical protein
MVVIDGSQFFVFVEKHRAYFKDSPVINALMDLKDLAKHCCKCERKQKMEQVVSYFGSLGQKVSEEDKRVIKELNGGQIVQVTMGEHLVLEIL